MEAESAAEPLTFVTLTARVEKRQQINSATRAVPVTSCVQKNSGSGGICHLMCESLKS